MSVFPIFRGFFHGLSPNVRAGEKCKPPRVLEGSEFAVNNYWARRFGPRNRVSTMPPSNNKSPPIRYLANLEKPNRNRFPTSMGLIISFTRELPIMTSFHDLFRGNAALFHLCGYLVESQGRLYKSGAHRKRANSSVSFGGNGLSQCSESEFGNIIRRFAYR